DRPPRQRRAVGRYHRAADQYGGWPARRRLRQGRRDQKRALLRGLCVPAQGVSAIAFSSEVDAGSREENASKQESGASVLIQSEPIMLQNRALIRSGQLTPVVFGFAQQIVPVGARR